jgi:hypothetical protein
MKLHSEQYPYIYFRGRATTFTRSERTENSYFGGPSKVAVKGAKHGPRRIHHIATISTADLGIADSKFGSAIPFYYGMCFECCDLNYKLPLHTMAVVSAPWIEVTEIEPNVSSDDWPYADYPQLLPYIPLEIQETIEMPLEMFSESVMQGVDTLSDEELVLVVPPNTAMGVSLWGPWGDAADVQVIFIYNTKTAITRAYNACT